MGLFSDIMIGVQADTTKARASFKQLDSALVKNRNALHGVTSGYGKWFQNNKKMRMGLANMTQDVNRSSKAIRGFSGSMGKLNRVIGLTNIYFLSRVIGGAINSAMAMTETVNLFSVSLGDMAVEVGKNVQALSELSGLDVTNLQNSVGTYALLARSMGMSTKQASILGENTAKLAIDLSSLTDVDIQQVMGDLRSGLVGQSETVYKYGMDVTEAGIKAEAMAQGITKSVRNMSQGEKMALRYSVMLKNSTLAQGDFARTLDTAANQTRILKERVVTLSRAFGSMFMPALEAVLPYLNAFVKLLTMAFNAIAKFLGFVAPSPENTNNAIGGVVEDAENAENAIGGASSAVKKFKNSLMGFDEINLLSQPEEPSGGGGGGGGMDFGGSILDDFEVPTYDNLFGDMESNMTRAFDSMMEVVNFFGDGISKINFAPLVDGVDRVWYQFKRLTELVVVGGFVWAWNNVLLPFGTWSIEQAIPETLRLISEVMRTLYTAIEEVSPSLGLFFNEILVPMGQWVADGFIETVTSMADSLAEFNNSIDNNEQMQTILGNLSEFIGTMLSVGGTIAVVGGMAGLIATLSERLVKLAIGFDKLKKIPVIGKLFSGLSGLALDLGAKFEGLLVMIKGLGIGGFLGLIAIVALVVGSIFELIRTNETFRQTWKTVFENVLSILKTIWDKGLKPIFETVIWVLSQIWERGLKPLWDIWLEAFGNILINLGGFINAVLPIINALIGMFLDDVVPVIQWLGKVFVDVITVLLENAGIFLKGFSGIFGGVIKALTGVIEFLHGAFTGNWKKAFDGLAKIAGGAWEAIKAVFSTGGKIFDGIKDGIATQFKAIVNVILRGLESVIQTPFRTVNNMLNKIRNFEVLGLQPLKWAIPYNSVKIPSLPRLARGGMLDDGMFFEAGEMGKAELIGSHRGKTTVMPLEDSGFVNAMSEAVYSAVVSAMGMNNSDGNGDIILQVDGTEFARTSVKAINKLSKKEGRVSLNIG